MDLARLQSHVDRLRKCRMCSGMSGPPVSCGPVPSRILLVGQAPGTREPILGRPFAWTAGRVLFQWFYEACGWTEEQFRRRIYMAAVCRCFPGKNDRGGGDRVPERMEIENCSRWLEAEISMLKPELVIPVGKLAIQQFLAVDRLDRTVGRVFRLKRDEWRTEVIPLPHPSGLSTWPRMQPGKTLLGSALAQIAAHPAIQRASSTLG